MRGYRYLLLSAIGPSIIPFAAACAQSAPAPRADNDASDVIVTARRTEERLQDVPISITVFNQQQITNRNIVTAADLGTYTPSLSTNGRFGQDASSFAIRGFTQETQTAPSVGVYFADVVAPRAQGINTSGNGAGPGAFFDLQNVQVLKGPQGTLQGRNTTGGAVLLVPQKPTSELGGYVEGSYGNYNMKRVQGVLNVPLSDVARFRIGADWQQRDGYEHNISGIGPKDFDDLNYVAVRASLVVDLTPNLESYTIATFSQSDTNGYVPKLAYCNPAGGTFGALACAQIARDKGFYTIENSLPQAQQWSQQWQVINTNTWRASDTLTIKNIAAYGEYRQKLAGNIFGENFHGPATLPPLVPFPGFFNPVPIAPGQPIGFVSEASLPGQYASAESTLSEELQFQGRGLNDKLTWQAGFYFEKSSPVGPQHSYAPILASCTNLFALQCSDPIGAASPGAGGLVGHVTDSFSAYNFRDIAGYAQATYHFTGKLALTGGIRYTSDKETDYGRNANIFFPAPNFPLYICNTGATNPSNNTIAANTLACAFRDKPIKSSKPTWLIDIDYKPNDDLLLFAKWARGYRMGGVNASNPGFPGWGPEKVDDYEGGLKSTFRGALHATFDVTGFYDDFRNQQLAAIANSLAGNQISPIVNAGKSRMWGVEVDSSITPFRGLRLDVGYAYLNTKLISIADIVAPPGYLAVHATGAVGQPLTLSPKNRITATGTYTLPLDESIGKISAGATFTHTDSEVADYGSPLGRLPATDLLNLNLNWERVAGSPISLSLFATNVTNQHYWVFSSGAYSQGFESYIVGQPRMYGARLRWTFGK